VSVRICRVAGEYVMFYEGAEYMHAQSIQSYVIPQTRVRELLVTQEKSSHTTSMRAKRGVMDFQTRLRTNDATTTAKKPRSL
jgi:hypothetical protein